MNFHVIGIKVVDYVSRKTGKPVHGVELQCTYDDKRVSGSAVEKVYCSSNVEVSHVQIGDTVRILYNRFGSVDFVEVL